MISGQRKHRIGRAFDAVTDYDRRAIVQRQVASRLAARIEHAGVAETPCVLEIGCGTGFLTSVLRDRIDAGLWIGSDLAPTMVARAMAMVPQIQPLVMDGERPCFANGCFDLICSSLAFQWFDDIGGGLARLERLLRPGGVLAFATIIEGNFPEWRAAHAAEGTTAGAPNYPTTAALYALLAGLGLAVSVEGEEITRNHDNADAFLAEVRGIGAGVPRSGHRPLPPGVLRRVMRRFEQGGAIATYRIAYVVARSSPSAP